jgi:hypothetical protein
MGDRRWEIGICGTFDVANYGDLLFPLIAEAELTERLGEVTLHRFSYASKMPPAWPYEVTSVSVLPEMIHRLDGLLIGGGFLIRFDKQVAPGYAPPNPGIHHPTGYWLTPALLALQHNVPLVWNAPGMHCNDIPAWAHPLMETALTLSSYVSVRDEPSRSAIQPLTRVPVDVVPDTAFRLPRLLNLDGAPSAEFTRLTEACGLDGPYIVVQATLGLEGFVQFLKNHSEQFRNLRILALPIGPVLGERHEIIDADLPGVVRLSDWPSPLLIAELLGRSEAVVGHSYHLFITALASGVPVFTRQNLSTGKYFALQHFETIFALPPNGEPDVDWFLERIGRTAPSAAVHSTCEPLRRHWDRIAAAVQAERAPTAPALNRFWQSLPAVLEQAAAREHEAIAALVKERAEGQHRLQEALSSTCAEPVETPEHLDDAQTLLNIARRAAAETQARLDRTQAQLALAQQEASERQARLDAMVGQLAAARAETAERDARIAEIEASVSWRLTAPVRFAGRQMMKSPGAKTGGRRLLNLAQIRHHGLETEPYRWAAIKDLFNPNDAARLAATYPCDHFKLVAAHGGEKDYEYEARPLIGMGANVIAYPGELSDAWRALAADLLSPEYRAAMTALTGCDLTRAPMEVNVFHYGPGASLGAHPDLPDKVVTHVLYFNRSWNSADGGCLTILRSADSADVAAVIQPIVGNSAVLVRSDNSWHAVSRVVNPSASSRRSVTVTFYRPGSVSSMWPPNDTTPLHRYHAADLS